MPLPRRQALAPGALPPADPYDTASPLHAAIAAQDRDAMAMVQRAVDRQDVLLAFQPIFATGNVHRPAFYEGLIRILDETGRIIPARDFIGAVETSELGRKIDCLSLEMGLISLAADPDLRLAINMSARSIGYPRWTRILRDGLAARPGTGARLILEITEASAMQMPEIVSVFMADLQAEGVSFALDDFGAGYTSFRYLRQFYFDILKIDGQFITGIAQNPDNQVLTQALLSIGRHFDMLTVAEAVESADDAAFLAGIGVDCMQGYYFGAASIVPPWEAGGRPRRKRA